MRIISGKYKGRQLKVPKGLKLRPTTDFAREALFSIIESRLDLTEIRVLDLFAGTGHISFEFASRGCGNITCVEKDVQCVRFIRKTSDELELGINVIRDDVFRFLEGTRSQFDVVFADPPFETPDYGKLHSLVFEGKLLAEHGMLIMEHGPRTKLDQLKNFTRLRKYGNVNFSFFEEEAQKIQ